MPRSFLAALVILAAFACVLIWDQWAWWTTRDEYMFGFLVPVFVGYVLFDRWPRIVALLRDAESRSPASLPQRVVRFVCGVLLVCGMAMFALGAFYRAGAGVSQPGSLAMAMGFAVITLSVVYLSSPLSSVRPCEPSSPSRSSLWKMLLREPGMQMAALFLFPAVVWVISAPLVSAVENALSTFLLGKVTSVVFFAFDTLGFPLERQGSRLALPKGDVGIAEACSGIRSLTGSIFSGLFLAAVFLDRVWAKIGLLLAAIAIAFLMNIVRSLTLTGVAYAKGPEAIEGRIHDVTGFAVLGGTFVCLLLLLPLFSAGGAARGREA